MNMTRINVKVYGLKGADGTGRVMQLPIDATIMERDYNPCYDRVVVPDTTDEGFDPIQQLMHFNKIVGPMFDGDYWIDPSTGEELKVMNRYETMALSHELSI